MHCQGVNHGSTPGAKQPADEIQKKFQIFSSVVEEFSERLLHVFRAWLGHSSAYVNWKSKFACFRFDQKTRAT